MPASRDDTATLVVSILVVLVLLAGGLVFVGRRAAAFKAMAEAQREQAVGMEARVRAETARAEEESRRAGAVSGFLSDSLASADPNKPGDRNATLRQALDQAAAKLDEGSVKDPAAAASIHSALGQSYLGLGDLDAAEKQFKAALELHIKALGETDPAVAAARADLDKVAKARAR